MVDGRWLFYFVPIKDIFEQYRESTSIRMASKDEQRKFNLKRFKEDLAKNVLVRYLREGDLENALPVLAQGFDFSQAEVREIRESRQKGLRGAAARLGLRGVAALGRVWNRVRNS